MTVYQPTLNSRERILLIGGAGSGKSHSAYDVAKRVSTSDNTVWVIDNDFSFERMYEMDPPETDGQFIVEDTQPDDWEALMEALERAVGGAGTNDLLIIDSMTPTWQAAQEYFTDQIFDQGMDEYFLDARKNMHGASLDTYDGWKDWSVINKIYGKLYRLINRFPGHVILTAEADVLGTDASDDLKSLLGPHRIKPRGQKGLAHRVNTIVLLTKTRQAEYQMTTIKDRGRSDLAEKEPVSSFFNSYMLARANWKAT